MAEYTRKDFADDVIASWYPGGEDAAARAAAHVNSGGHNFPPASKGTKTCTACGLVIDVDTAWNAGRPCLRVAT